MPRSPTLALLRIDLLPTNVAMKDKNKSRQAYLEVPTFQYLQPRSFKHQLHSIYFCISPLAAYSMHESDAGGFLDLFQMLLCYHADCTLSMVDT